MYIKYRKIDARVNKIQVSWKFEVCSNVIARKRRFVTHYSKLSYPIAFIVTTCMYTYGIEIDISRRMLFYR